MPNDTRLPLVSADLEAERLASLRALFPEAFPDGELDFAHLQRLLGAAADEKPERYGLGWAGKSAAERAYQTPSTGTLLPAPDESVNFDTTENLIIEGDNLEVLKLLQGSYHRQVKMIYIDPPYNTGNDFIYPDNFKEPLQQYLRFTGQVGENGVKMVANTEERGRFHSDWLSMMLPRLHLAKNLLHNKGVIFVSIDDNEIYNLRLLMDEVFGPENFVTQFAWQSRQSIQNDTDISVNHEYIVAYSRLRRKTDRRLKEANAQKWYSLPGFAAYPLPLDINKFSNVDNDARGLWKADPFDAPNIRQNLTYKITNPNTGQVYLPPSGRCWRTEEVNYHKLFADKRIVFGRKGESGPQLKVFYEEKKAFGEVDNTWYDGNRVGTTTGGTKALMELFDGRVVFDNPKPTSMIHSLLQIATRPGDIVLDFFAGSGSTADAILQLNAREKTKRNYILVQLPVKTPENSEAKKIGLDTIFDIVEERVRRVITKLNSEQSASSQRAVSEQSASSQRAVSEQSASSQRATGRQRVPGLQTRAQQLPTLEPRHRAQRRRRTGRAVAALCGSHPPRSHPKRRAV